MKLQAVTICINYADYLECIVENRKHFDRWVVMTAPADQATHDLCALHGIECQDSALLRTDGKDFHAVHNKGPILNEALEYLAHAPKSSLPAQTGAGSSEAHGLETPLEDPGWCVIFDADVLLPRHFRERVLALPLEPGAIYAAGGRKFCESREQFDLLRPHEPWERLVSRYSQALGFFNLFHLGTHPNRYPVRKPGLNGHDDWLFTTSFLEQRRKTLPFTVIHVGPAAENWGGRISKRYHATEEAPAGKATDFPSSLVNSPPHPSSSRAAVIGYFPGGKWKALLPVFSQIYLVDHFSIGSISGDPMREADRAVLRKLVSEEIAAAENVTILTPHSISSLAQVPDGSLDVLYFTGEISSDWLCSALPHWLPKLKEHGMICGDLYGLPHWPEATFTIALSLGVPARAAGGDFWWLQRSQIPRKALAEYSHEDEGDGVVILHVGNDHLDALLLSLYACRQQWKGRIEVWHGGAQDESLRILAAKLEATLRLFCPGTGDIAELLAEAGQSSRFQRSLFLTSGMLPLEPLERVFSEDPMAQSPPPGAPRYVQRQGDGTLQQGSVAVADATTYQNGHHGDCLITFRGSPSEWTADAWSYWCEMESAMTLSQAAEICTAPDVLVTSIISPAEAGDFQRNWLTWRFPAGTPVRLIVIGFTADEYWLPGLSPEVQLIYASEAEAAGPELLESCCAAAESAGKSKLLFVPSTASALPGAELFFNRGSKTAESFVHSSEAAVTEEKITGNRFIPGAMFAVLSLEKVRSLARQAFHRDLLGVHLYAADPGAIRQDLETYGWRFPKWHHWVGASESAGVGISARRKDTKENSPPAEEVIVLQTGEDAAGHEQLRRTFRQQNVAHRLVRLSSLGPSDIQPSEIADEDVRGCLDSSAVQAYLCAVVRWRRTYLRILQDSYERRLESILIIEDQNHLRSGWRANLAQAVAELPRGWMFLSLSSGGISASSPCSSHLAQFGSATRVSAARYSRIGIEAALHCLRHSRSEMNRWMSEHFHRFGNSYVINPSLCDPA